MRVRKREGGRGKADRDTGREAGVAHAAEREQER